MIMLSAATEILAGPGRRRPRPFSVCNKSCRVGCEAEFCSCTTYFDHRSRLP